MATCFKGSSGAIALGSGDGTNIAQVTSWNVTETVDNIEVTHMGQSWRRYCAGLREFEGSFEAIYDGNNQGQGAGNPIKAGNTYTFHGYFEGADADTTQALDTDHKLSGPIMITSVEYTVEFDDLIRITANFVGNGKLTVDTEDTDTP